MKIEGGGMATTTIQIKRRNLRLLETLKVNMDAKSYDEVIELSLIHISEPTRPY